MIIHPRGADISKFMGKINNSYAKYYNRSYKRKGHVFAERYKNKVIDDVDYLLRATTYIHNNAKDLKYCNNILSYAYSSINDYINPAKGHGIARPNYVFEIIGKERHEARKYYLSLMEIQNNGIHAFKTIENTDFKENPMYYQNKKTYDRNKNPLVVIKSIYKYFANVDKKTMFKLNYSMDEIVDGITIIALRMFCDLNLKEVGLRLGNQSYSSLSRLSKIGLSCIEDKPDFLSKLFIKTL
jgi:REP element-mobilizing transposase RayT